MRIKDYNSRISHYAFKPAITKRIFNGCYNSIVCVIPQTNCLSFNLKQLQQK